jgi:hypothetical protein
MEHMSLITTIFPNAFSLQNGLRFLRTILNKKTNKKNMKICTGLYVRILSWIKCLMEDKDKSLSIVKWSLVIFLI